jgi:putative transposase
MLVGDTATYVKRRYRLWRRRPIGGRIKAGSFAQDARGRWYLSLAVDIAETRNCGIGEIGIDLALMTLATLSDGRKIGSPRHFNKYQALLAKAQRASKKNGPTRGFVLSSRGAQAGCRRCAPNLRC